MATTLQPFSDEQARTLINLDQHYRVWRDAERSAAELPYNLAAKEVKGRRYLYELTDRTGNGRSLGPWNAQSDARLADYRTTKAAAKTRLETSREVLAETCRLYRALRLPLLSSDAGAILREADRRGLLGSELIVVGTNMMPAYAIEAAAFIRDVPDETLDFDMAWSGTVLRDGAQPVWDMLKAVDPTYTVNTERPFQARTAKAYEFELLAAPSRIGSMFRTDKPTPVPLMEQEWLLEGQLVDHVVVCRDGTPARLVGPDPRWFALQKLWMANQKKRNPLKREKDRSQGRALLDTVSLTMPQYPLDSKFGGALPAELAAYFKNWEAQKPRPRAASW